MWVKGTQGDNEFTSEECFHAGDRIFRLWGSKPCLLMRWLNNSLGPSDAIWQQKTGSTLAQVMACCLTAPSHYLNQCWLIISKVWWHSFEGNFTAGISAINHCNWLEKHSSKISLKSPRPQWVKSPGHQQAWYCQYRIVNMQDCSIVNLFFFCWTKYKISYDTKCEYITIFKSIQHVKKSIFLFWSSPCQGPAVPLGLWSITSSLRGNLSVPRLHKFIKWFADNDVPHRN